MLKVSRTPKPYGRLASNLVGTGVKGQSQITPKTAAWPIHVYRHNDTGDLSTQVRYHRLHIPSVHSVIEKAKGHVIKAGKGHTCARTKICWKF